MRKFALLFVIIVAGFVNQSISQRDIYNQNQHYDDVKIGGLFDASKESEIMFRFSEKIINQINKGFVKIKTTSKKVSYGNEYNAAEAVCKMIEEGIIGIIAPSSPESAFHVRSICDAKEIPLIETSIDGSSKHVINLHPKPEDLGTVYMDMIRAWNWDGFTILYQDAPLLPLAEYILKNYNGEHTVTIRQLDVTTNENYRPQLWQVKQSQVTNIVLCSTIEALPEILKQAQQVGLMTDRHQFIITSLDMHTIDLEPFQYSGTNITGFRIVSPDDALVKQVTASIKDQYIKKNPWEDPEDRDPFLEGNNFQNSKEFPSGLTAEKLQLGTALIYDAMTLIAHGMAHHRGIRSESVNCNDPESTFVNGISIFNTMKTIPPFKGLSGEIQFDQLGNRENFQVEVQELTSEGLKTIGSWNSSKGIQTLKGKSYDASSTDSDSLKNKTLVVVTVINPPYGILKDTVVPLKGNDQYEGFGIELIEKLAARLGFNYTFVIREDKAYGSRNKDTGEWDGMIGMLMNDEADLAITDLTITAERESGVDFTMPFMNLGISILFEKPKKEDPELFSFMQPFSRGVWACLFACFFLVTCSLFAMGRLSPAEWDNPFPCIEEPEVLINQFSFKNAMWFSIGALLQQGSEIAPKAPSTRIVASLWWFFTLIMVSSYTANLAAFLTIENPSPIIESVKDLIERKVPFGAKSAGSTLGFFRDSTNPDYVQMYEYMIANPKLLKESNDEGLEEAKKGRYAFLMESSSIEYMTERHCEVANVGDKLDEKGYGIAMKKNSPYRGALSEAVLQMQESGEISRMKTKWWKEKQGGGRCSSSDSDGNVEKLNMKNLGGVFVVLACGSGFAIILGVFRWCYNMGRMSRSFDIPFSEVFREEVRFFRQFGTNVKTLQTRKSSSQLNSVNGSNGTRSRSSAAKTNNNEPVGFRMSLKNINKAEHDDLII